MATGKGPTLLSVCRPSFLENDGSIRQIVEPVSTIHQVGCELLIDTGTVNASADPLLCGISLPSCEYFWVPSAILP